LANENVVPFLKKCIKHLNETFKGILVLKESTRREDDDEVDAKHDEN
jgi:hypothetical protein